MEFGKLVDILERTKYAKEIYVNNQGPYLITDTRKSNKSNIVSLLFDIGNVDYIDIPSNYLEDFEIENNVIKVNQRVKKTYKSALKAINYKIILSQPIDLC